MKCCSWTGPVSITNLNWSPIEEITFLWSDISNTAHVILYTLESSPWTPSSLPFLRHKNTTCAISTMYISWPEAERRECSRESAPAAPSPEALPRYNTFIPWQHWDTRTTDKALRLWALTDHLQLHAAKKYQTFCMPWLDLGGQCMCCRITGGRFEEYVVQKPLQEKSNTMVYK